MKKIYSLLVCLLPLSGIAQPTITQSDLPGPGSGWILATDGSFTGAIPSGGSGMTWNYTSLTGSNDTTAFQSVTGTPYQGTFSSSTCAQYDPSSGKWQYFTANSTGFYLDGGSGNPLLVLNPPFLYVPVPFTYNDTRQNDGRFVYDTSITSHSVTTYYRQVLQVRTDFNAIGWGTLNIPSGSYPNVLLEKSIVTTYDSLLIDAGGGNYVPISASASQEVDFRWVRDNATTPILLEIDADSLGTTANKSSYLISSFVLSTNDLHVTDNSLSIYPNPASDVLHINMEGNGSQSAIIKVYNSFGQEIMNKEAKGLNVMEIPVAEFKNGIYYYTLVSDGEKRSGKFSVVH